MIIFKDFSTAFLMEVSVVFLLFFTMCLRVIFSLLGNYFIKFVTYNRLFSRHPEFAVPSKGSLFIISSVLGTLKIVCIFLYGMA